MSKLRCVLVCVAAVCLATPAVSKPSNDRLQVSGPPTQMPDLVVTTIDGRGIRLRDLRGKVVLVNFWATWCSPCRAEIPILVDMRRQFGEPLIVIGVSEDHGEVTPVRRFAEALRVNYPIVMSTPALARAFSRDESVPTTFVIDRDGHVVRVHVGIVDRASLVEEVKVLLGLPQPSPRENRSLNR